MLIIAQLAYGLREDYDVVVYTGNAAGVMAAYQAARTGSRVMLVEPSRWLGGMTGGGIDTLDWGEDDIVGGHTRLILMNRYSNLEYRKAFTHLMENTENVTILFEHRVNGVYMYNGGIHKIVLDLAPFDKMGCPPADAKVVGNHVLTGKVFIDASYDGELMAQTKSGKWSFSPCFIIFNFISINVLCLHLAIVKYTYGREAQSQYDESLAGYEQLMYTYDVDPYIIPGDPNSGLIDMVQDFPEKQVGSADDLIMGYGFRWEFDYEGNGYPIIPTSHYDPKKFEVFIRGFAKGNNALEDPGGIFMGRKITDKNLLKEEINSGGMSAENFKFPTNLKRSLFSPTPYGHNKDYPDGAYKDKARIWKEQQDYVRDLVHFLKTHDSVPDPIRKRVSRLTLSKKMFPDTYGYPHQLYIREARRMVSDYVITQHDLENRKDFDDSVGLAAYGVDEWPYATIVKDGKVALQGGYLSNMKIGGAYRIPYRAIRPKKAECTNLLVPVAMSSSHIAMTSLRMEPVYMTLGEAAGVAASIAAMKSIPVQDIAYEDLKAKFEEFKIVYDFGKYEFQDEYYEKYHRAKWIPAKSKEAFHNRVNEIGNRDIHDEMLREIKIQRENEASGASRASKSRKWAEGIMEGGSILGD